MRAVLIGMVAAGMAMAQLQTRPSQAATPRDYVLGPDDQLKIWALGFDEFGDKPFHIDPTGYIDLPTIGRIKAGGQTLAELRSDLLERMKKLVKQPQVSIDIVAYGSQPVTVMGAVNQSGVLQLQGNKRLMEVIAQAGGLRADAGSTIKIARDADRGPLPVANAAPDPTGKYTVAELRIPELLAAKDPAANIVIEPHDVITVPLADKVSVIGDVVHPGPIMLNNRPTITTLEALAMAQGYGPQPQPQHAKILRVVPGTNERKEIAVNLQRIQAGKAEDISLRPDDILLIPTSMPKRVGVKAGEAALSALIGIAAFRTF